MVQRRQYYDKSGEAVDTQGQEQAAEKQKQAYEEKKQQEKQEQSSQKKQETESTSTGSTNSSTSKTTSKAKSKPKKNVMSEEEAVERGYWWAPKKNYEEPPKEEYEAFTPSKPPRTAHIVSEWEGRETGEYTPAIDYTRKRDITAGLLLGLEGEEGALERLKKEKYVKGLKSVEGQRKAPSDMGLKAWTGGGSREYGGFKEPEPPKFDMFSTRSLRGVGPSTRGVGVNFNRIVSLLDKPRRLVYEAGSKAQNLSLPVRSILYGPWNTASQALFTGRTILNKLSGKSMGESVKEALDYTTRYNIGVATGFTGAFAGMISPRAWAEMLDKKTYVDTGKSLMSGNPYTIGAVTGSLAAAFIGFKGFRGRPKTYRFEPVKQRFYYSEPEGSLAVLYDKRGPSLLAAEKGSVTGESLKWYASLREAGRLVKTEGEGVRSGHYEFRLWYELSDKGLSRHAVETELIKAGRGKYAAKISYRGEVLGPEKGKPLKTFTYEEMVILNERKGVYGRVAYAKDPVLEELLVRRQKLPDLGGERIPVIDRITLPGRLYRLPVTFTFKRGELADMGLKALKHGAREYGEMETGGGTRIGHKTETIDYIKDIIESRTKPSGSGGSPRIGQKELTVPDHETMPEPWTSTSSGQDEDSGTGGGEDTVVIPEPSPKPVETPVQVPVEKPIQAPTPKPQPITGVPTLETPPPTPPKTTVSGGRPSFPWLPGFKGKRGKKGSRKWGYWEIDYGGVDPFAVFGKSRGKRSGKRGRRR